MGKPNENVINVLPKILKRLSNGEDLCVDTLAKEYNAPYTTLIDNINKHIISSFPDDIRFSRSTNKLVSNKSFLSETLLTAEEIITMSILEVSSNKYGKEFNKNTRLLFDRFKKRASLLIYKKTNFEKITRDYELIFAQIKNAIIKKNILNCIYNNKERIIYPLKIVMFDGYWYVLVFEEETKTLKTFHLKSIRNIRNIEEVFSLDSEGNITEKLNSAVNANFKDKELMLVELYVHNHVVRYFERIPLSKNQIITDIEDDNYKKLEIYITDYMEIIPYIQQYLPFVKVIYPNELENIIKFNLAGYPQEDLSEYLPTN